MEFKKIQYADDDKTSINRLFEMRIPSLMIGLALGILLSFVTSRFEEVLVKDIKIAFFLPFIVYMAAAVGNQTQSIYIRDLKSGKASFKKYLVKEMLLGVILAIVSSFTAGAVVMMWFGSLELTLAVALGMLGAIVSAPLVALVVVELLALERTDPAVGAGPIATIIQDTISVVIYGFIASSVVL